MGASLEKSAPCFIQECAGTLSTSKSAWYSPVSNYMSRAPEKKIKQLSPHEPTNSKVVQANPPLNTQPETAAALPVQGLTHATVRSHKGQQQQQQSQTPPWLSALGPQKKLS
ncbi:hypothetical protein Pmani_011501 [Petrolisthes manimaculis]|uniref:Uncharacterized protein n=1 Tax=Petrolisthes manimaculis TaxID=1843537 RepID=A0AAE1UBI1_9EUCA|nr:hypothetical protein Pmani_011501 [Petrolisthes manimaculis]